MYMGFMITQILVRIALKYHRFPMKVHTLVLSIIYIRLHVPELIVFVTMGFSLSRPDYLTDPRHFK